MNPTRPGNSSEKLYSIQEASEKLGASIEQLLNWNKNHILKPTITEAGQVAYTQNQINQFLEIQSNLQGTGTGPEKTAPSSKDDAGRGSSETNSASSQDFPSSSIYQSILLGLAGVFRNDEFSQQYAESRKERPEKLGHSKQNIKIASGILILLFLLFTLGAFTQESRIKFYLQKSGDKIEKQISGNGKVLQAQTSNLKLSGKVIITLPLEVKNKVDIEDNLNVGGEGVFVGNLTAPNILYSVQAGTGIEITNQESQNPTISVTGVVSSFQGQVGAVEITPGTDIAIDGTTISNISTFATILERSADCDNCIEDDFVADDLTIDSGGNINGEAIKSGVVSTSVGGTGLTTYTQGDLLYASASNELDVLPIGTVDGLILQISSGLPAWSSIALNAAGTTNLTSGANLVGVFDNLINSSSNNLQQVLSDLDASIAAAGVSPFSINTLTSPNVVYPTDLTYDFAFGAATPSAATLYFDSSAAALYLGTNNTGSGGLAGSITLFSSGNGVTDPVITATDSGDILIPYGNVGIGVMPVDLDADNNPFILEVAGSIGPSLDQTFDLGSPTRTFRDLYLSGTTTAGGDITISNADPSVIFNDTSIGEDQYSMNVDGSNFTIVNDTDGRIDLALDGNGNFDIAGGSGSTGCSIESSTGNLTCTGNIQTTAGAFEANGGSITSTATTLTIDAAGILALNDVVNINGGYGSNAALSINQLNNGDLINASASGTTRFRVRNTGELVLGDNYSTFFSTIDIATLSANRTYLLPDENGTFCLQGSIDCGFALGSENYWQLTNNLLHSNNDTFDFAIGGDSTESAKFAVLNVADSRGNQIATLSGDLVLDAEGSLTTTNLQTLTLGGSSTGNIVIDSGSGLVNINDNTTINGTLTLSGGSTDIITGVDEDLTLSPNGTGNLILASDSDTSVLIGSASTPAPLSIAGGIGGNAALIVDQLNSGDIFTASASGVTRFSVTNTGDLVIGDDGSSFFVTLTPNTLDQDRAQYLPNEDGTLCIQGSLACGFALGVNYFQLNNNLLSPINSTYDFAIGGEVQLLVLNSQFKF